MTATTTAQPAAGAAQAIIAKVQGRAIPVRGNDIDTDRIIPARFLRCVVFDGLGEHSFEDDRLGLKAKGQTHAFDDARFQGAKVLFVNKNFGCGSSREHAPQALMRWGIQAIVGESFAEIFFGNCVSLGIPCFVAGEESLARLMDAAEKNPIAEWSVDVEAGMVKGPVEEAATLPAGPKSQFLSGRWNSLNELLTNLPVVDKVASGLPYVSGW
ncbi:MAG: 3-isopropylmalate dehydratase, small subunit [Fibrobacteres bacterium]|nr:3-isopropylmalate dehydratase, small subunit [Fibrobacterota bacterium]